MTGTALTFFFFFFLQWHHRPRKKKDEKKQRRTWGNFVPPAPNPHLGSKWNIIFFFPFLFLIFHFWVERRILPGKWEAGTLFVAPLERFWFVGCMRFARQFHLFFALCLVKFNCRRTFFHFSLRHLLGGACLC